MSAVVTLHSHCRMAVATNSTMGVRVLIREACQRVRSRATFPILMIPSIRSRLRRGTFDDANTHPMERCAPPTCYSYAVRMSRKKMFFSSARAKAELGYTARPARQAIVDAVAWFNANGYLR